jgi:hypothetical protein
LKNTAFAMANPVPPGFRLPPLPSRDNIIDSANMLLQTIAKGGGLTNSYFSAAPITGSMTLRGARLSNQHYNNNIQHTFTGPITLQHESTENTPVEDIQMGFTREGSNTENACGWIAAYNVFYLLGMDIHPASIVRYIERNNGLLFDGKFGVNPTIYEQLFEHWGVTAQTTVAIPHQTATPRNLDAKARSGRTAILCYFWTNNNRVGAHYISIMWNPLTRHYTAWNVSSSEPVVDFESINDFLNSGPGTRTFISLTVVDPESITQEVHRL